MDILGCTGTVSQRATVLHKLILLAQALKEHAHNLYSFSAVMKALEMPQVTKICLQISAKRTQAAVFSHCWYVCAFTCADSATGDDMASTEEEPHGDCGFIREGTQTLHELVERGRR